MALSISEVLGKARAFVDALTHMPRSAHAANPNGHFAREYNILRQLALESAPDIDERLCGKFIQVFETPNGELSRATYTEIEVYARQILEQLILKQNLKARSPIPRPTSSSISASDLNAKAYDVEEIRKRHVQAYQPWTLQDDEYLRTRYLDNATISNLADEFGRNEGAIRSRLRKLGLDSPSAHSRK